MFKDVQQLKLKLLEDELAQLRNEKLAMRDEVESLREQLRFAEVRLSKLEWQEKNGLCAFRGKNLSPWERFVSKRREYHAYQAALVELKALPDKIAVLPFQIKIAEMEARDKLAASDIWQRMQKVQQQISNLQKATTLAHLGMTPAEAVEMLKHHGIIPVLDASDRVIFERPRNYQNQNSLIGVHEMDIMPLRSRLSTAREIEVDCTKEVFLDEKPYRYHYRVEHDSVHFALNGEFPLLSTRDAKNHDLYAVLQPLFEIPRQKIGGITAADTFTRGGVDLTANAWILCPVEKIKMVQEFNPHVHVIGYVGDNVRGYVEPLIAQLGYRAEQVKLSGWTDLQSQQALTAWLKRENLPAVRYYQSTDYEDDRFCTSANQVIAMLQMMLNENLVQSVTDFKRLRPQLLTRTDFHFAMKNLMRPTMITDQTCIDATAVVANRQQTAILTKKMAQAGIPLSPTDKTVLQTQFTDGTSDMARAQRKGLSRVELLTRMMVNSAVRARVTENQTVPIPEQNHL